MNEKNPRFTLISYSSDIISLFMSLRSLEVTAGKSASVFFNTSLFAIVFFNPSLFEFENAALLAEMSEDVLPDALTITRSLVLRFGKVAGSTGTERSGRISPPIFCAIALASSSSSGPMFLRVFSKVPGAKERKVPFLVSSSVSAIFLLPFYYNRMTYFFVIPGRESITILLPSSSTRTPLNIP